MKKLLTLFASLILCVSSAFADKVTDHLQDVSVTIVTSKGQGSGVVKTRGGVAYVLTAAHVVASHRRTRTVVDAATSSVKTLVYFEPVGVVKDVIENGRRVGRLIVDAEVIKYSDVEVGEDLAILKIYKKNFVNSNVQFYLDEQIPFCGTELYHVGSLLGIFGANSLTKGIYSQQGRILDNHIFDQGNFLAMPGSSGGGVFLTDGRYVGMLVRGSSDSMNFFVPIRRMLSWMQANHLDFILNDALPVDNTVYPVENMIEAPSITGERQNREEESFKGFRDYLNRDFKFIHLVK